jgi:hypothetical protein
MQVGKELVGPTWSIQDTHSSGGLSASARTRAYKSAIRYVIFDWIEPPLRVNSIAATFTKVEL